MIGKRWSVLGGAGLAALILAAVAGAHAEYNPVSHPPGAAWPCGRPPDRRLSRHVEQHRGTKPSTRRRAHDRQESAGPAPTPAISPHSRSEWVERGEVAPADFQHARHLFAKNLVGADADSALSALRAECRSRIRRGGPTSFTAHATAPNDPFVRSVGECNRAVVSC